MKKIKVILPVFFLINVFVSQAQAPVDSIKFFTDDNLIDMTLTTDIRKLQTEKKLNVYQPANAIVRMPDSSVITEDIRLYLMQSSRTTPHPHSPTVSTYPTRFYACDRRERLMLSDCISIFTLTHITASYVHSRYI